MVFNIFIIKNINILEKIKFKIGQIFTISIIMVYFLKWIILDGYNIYLFYVYISTISSYKNDFLNIKSNDH
jgi:hypothetical protein